MRDALTTKCAVEAYSWVIANRATSGGSTSSFRWAATSNMRRVFHAGMSRDHEYLAVNGTIASLL